MRYLKIQTLDNNYYDRDSILLHAAFQILVDFIEKEQPDKIVDWNYDRTHKHVWREMRSLYKWWEEIRPSRRSPLYDEKLVHPPHEFKKISGSTDIEMIMPDEEEYASYYQALKEDIKLERKWHKEDQRNLHRLIEIRAYLWT